MNNAFKTNTHCHALLWADECSDSSETLPKVITRYEAHQQVGSRWENMSQEQIRYSSIFKDNLGRICLQ